MLNQKDDPRKTIFLDIDGVLVEHNYDPENIPDKLIPSTVEYLKENKDNCIILTTSRIHKHLKYVEALLILEGIHVSAIITDLPTGQRILINDCKDNDSSPKAIAVNVHRDEGVSNDRDYEFYRKWCSKGNRNNRRSG